VRHAGVPEQVIRSSSHPPAADEAANQNGFVSISQVIRTIPPIAIDAPSVGRRSLTVR
jgi:hypothetical protein